MVQGNKSTKSYQVVCNSQISFAGTFYACDGSCYSERRAVKIQQIMEYTLGYASYVISWGG